MRQSRMLFIYAGFYALALMCVFLMPQSSVSAMGYSLIMPGSGFLGGWSLGLDGLNIDTRLFLASIMALGFAGFLWFATGNVILPPLTWLIIAISSYIWQSGKTAAIFDPLVTGFAFTIGPIGIIGLGLYRHIALRRGQSRRAALNQKLTALAPTQTAQIQSPDKDELSLEELQHMRLLLDRALQPLDEFEGFEWLDQFQTAAVRYQINFISYALSLAQSHYMPDFTGYITQAQQNLKAKQENHRIWKYWQLENIWGNLRTGADPIARDNIMYSGFVGAQLAYARQAGPRDAASLDGLTAQSGSHKFDYTQEQMMQVLIDQYKSADYGLLSCEPNWVYPLCNAISATAIRAQDTHQGTAHWESIAEGFQHALETEFMTPSGELIPFRSNYTGFAPPQIGGVVMQAFPCFFLNALLPELAQRQWNALKLNMEGKDWRRALWPADVGNYNFSRASSYAASALAAREMGDNKTADLLLEYLEADCPTIINGGVAHHSNASLWANANAFMAKINTANGLQRLVTTARKTDEASLYLAEADPMDVLIAKAKNENGRLSITAYPAHHAGFKQFTIAGLTPNASYKLKASADTEFKALPDGTQIINVPINGRTAFTITPIH